MDQDDGLGVDAPVAVARPDYSSLDPAEEQFQVLAAQAPIGIFRLDAAGAADFLNARCAEILGVDHGAGARWLDNLDVVDRERLFAGLVAAAEGGSLDLDPLEIIHLDGTRRWVALRAAAVGGMPATGYVGSVEDVTERRELEQTLVHESTHDRLTGLPNRTLLWRRLERAVSDEERCLAVLFLDIDDFKLVNDSLGHETGDRLLVVVAERLKHAVRPRDLVTRFGGDEFVVVCSEVGDSAAAEVIAERLSRSISHPINLGGREVLVNASIGVVLADEHTLDPESLLRDADVALYQAKTGGKSRWAMFDERAREGAAQRLAMASELRRAVDEGALSVHYQPIVDLVTNRMVGVEALARWEDHRFGSVPPDQFIALAEDIGIIDRLGAWVLQTALLQFAQWRVALGDAAPDHISVNLSVRQLSDPNLFETVQGALAASGIEPQRLCLELTESVFMEDHEHAVALLARLKASGVRLSMDDFGTGYSSLSALRHFPGDGLKIDRSFVKALSEDASGEPIVAAIVALSQALNLLVIAEGIETDSDAQRVRDLGCDRAQGYHLARPMSPERFVGWVEDYLLQVAS